MSKRFKIIYPEKRTVPESVIEGWFSDAVADKKIDADQWGTSVEEHARALDDLGWITLGRD